MNPVDFLSADQMRLVVEVVSGLTLVLPFAEWVAKKTPFTEDDKIVAFVKMCLSYVPRLTAPAFHKDAE